MSLLARLFRLFRRKPEPLRMGYMRGLDGNRHLVTNRVLTDAEKVALKEAWAECWRRV